MGMIWIGTDLDESDCPRFTSVSIFLSSLAKGCVLYTSVFIYSKLYFLFRIVAETSTGCLLAGSSLGKRGKDFVNRTF